MGFRRLEPLLVLVLFGLPLFVGLGQTDLANDEASHAFSVDRILETGEWLIPRASPNDDAPFLEKPPLKFWLVAAPIRLGLLPHDEFGLRFWDAAFGAAAFLYVFVLGRRLAGPVCGLGAAFLLFGQWDLIFTHGFRSNNMEAALVLCYCAGVYHYVAWAGSGAGAGGRHVYSIALAFALGFMTKSVAALFLPAVLLTVSILLTSVRQRVWVDRAIWIRASLLALALILPWYLSVWWIHGGGGWEVLFVQPASRLTIDGTVHDQPWHFYLTSRYQSTATLVLVGLGTVLLLGRVASRRTPEATAVLVWLVLPVGIISAMELKLYHYMYPFLPPLALAGGYTASTVLAWHAWVLARMSDVGESLLPRAGVCRWAAAVDWDHMPRWWRSSIGRPDVRMLALAAVLAVVVWTALTVVAGLLKIDVGEWSLLTNAWVLRPLLIVLAILVFAERVRPLRLAVALTLLVALPTSTYRYLFELPTATYGEVMRVFPLVDHPIRTVRDCVAEVSIEAGRDGVDPPSLLVHVPGEPLLHPVNYYFRRLRPWQVVERPSYPAVYGRLFGLAERGPVLLHERWHEGFMGLMQQGDDDFVAEVATVNGVTADYVRDTAVGPMPAAVSVYFYDLLLPAPYDVCAL